jgi:hypothetical protein
MSTAPRAERRSAKAAPRKRRRTGASATDAAEQRESEGLTEEGAQILALLVLLWRAERRAASPDSLVLPKGAKGKKPETQLHLARQMRGPWPKTDVGEALDTLIAALKHGKVGADLCAEVSSRRSHHVVSAARADLVWLALRARLDRPAGSRCIGRRSRIAHADAYVAGARTAAPG